MDGRPQGAIEPGSKVTAVGGPTDPDLTSGPVPARAGTGPCRGRGTYVPGRIGDRTYYPFQPLSIRITFRPTRRGSFYRAWRPQPIRPKRNGKLFQIDQFQKPHFAQHGGFRLYFYELDEGEKVVQVDLIASQQVKFFTFFVQIPGMRVDYQMVDFDSLYSTEEIANLNQAELRTALENLPCCTMNEAGSDFGDPLNLVIIGDFLDVAATFSRRGWLPAEETYSTAVWKTIKSFLFGKRYRYSPVSSLYAYGRHQDLARQKPRHNIHERNHLRLWYSPIRFEGKPVFVGQISRDIGVRFTTKTWPPVTHKIDPDIDEARHALIEDLLFSQTLAKVGFVKGVGRATPSRPRHNLTGDPYFTDGLRAVLFLDQGPISMNQILEIDWEHPRTFQISE